MKEDAWLDKLTMIINKMLLITGILFAAAKILS